MASRVATLVKPKPKAKTKPKASAKTIASKSLVAKPAASAKSSSVAPAAKTASAQLKASSAKDSVAKASASKPTAIKPSLAKVAKPVAKASSLDKPGALKIKAKASSADASGATAGTASLEPAAPKPRRRSKAEAPTRIYWAVFNQSLRRVAVFEFDQRGEAEKRAAKLAKASGEHHFIQKQKIKVTAQ